MKTLPFSRRTSEVGGRTHGRLLAPLALLFLLATSACSDQPAPLAPSPAAPAEASPLIVPAIGVYTQITEGTGGPMCGLRNDGMVRCWGATLVEKTAATGLFSLVRSARGHSCAIRTDGAAECWGDNSRGEAPPVVVPPSGTRFQDLGLGFGYSCGLRNDGVVQCWGASNSPDASPAARRATSGLFVGSAQGSTPPAG